MYFSRPKTSFSKSLLDRFYFTGNVQRAQRNKEHFSSHELLENMNAHCLFRNRKTVN